MARLLTAIACTIRQPAFSAIAAVALLLPVFSTPALARGPDGIADVAERVIDAVVNISTSQTVESRATPTPPQARQQETAQQEGETTKGEGDAQRTRIFAQAFGKDPAFASFYRSMQAYEASMKHNDTRMLLRPDSEFFRYFVDPFGKPRDSAPTPPRVPAPATR